MIVGIDPGKHSGYVVTSDLGAYLFRLNSFPVEPYRAVVELPEIRKGARGKIAPQSVVTLAFDAGRRIEELGLGYYCRGAYALTPTMWKNTIYRNGISVVKSVFISRLRRDFNLPEELTDDECDAFGIARALSILLQHGKAGKYEIVRTMAFR